MSLAIDKLNSTLPANRGLPLTARQEHELMAYYEQVYWETSQLPSDELVSSKTGFPIARIKKFRSSQWFQDQLKARGMSPGETLGDGVLTPEQIVIANMYLNTWDNTSMRQKLEILGISTAQFAAWKRDPAFSRYLQVRAEEQFKASDAAAFKTLTKAVEGGDLNATKLYFEMRGRYQPRVHVSVDIQSILVRMVEIVAKHVDQPETIEAIATELEELTRNAS